MTQSDGGGTGPRTSGADEYRSQPPLDEVLVALPHERLVLQQLEPFTRDSRITRNDVLGLARVPLSRQALEAAGAHFRPRSPSAGGPAADPRRPPDTAPPLDWVLWGLRRELAERHGGWTPTIGKNRLVAPVEGHGDVRGVGKLIFSGNRTISAAEQRTGVPADGPGRGALVGVVDTGLSPHPALSGRAYGRPTDVLRLDEEISPLAAHATFVSGLVLSQAPGAHVEVRRALDSTTATGDLWTVATAIVELDRAGVDVLNLSIACYTDDGEPPLALAVAMDRLDPETVVVVAAGNHGNGPADVAERPSWPAALDDVVAVGAATNSGARADFSPDAPWVDLLAPGEDVVSTFFAGRRPVDETTSEPDVAAGGWATWSGTSFSAALVSGVLAAATVPGRVTAREAWQSLQSGLEHPPSTQGSGTSVPSCPVRLLW